MIFGHLARHHDELGDRDTLLVPFLTFSITVTDTIAIIIGQLSFLLEKESKWPIEFFSSLFPLFKGKPLWVVHVSIAIYCLHVLGVNRDDYPWTTR